MVRWLWLLSALSMSVSSSPVHASRIVVSAAPDLEECSLTMEAGMPVTVYALAVLGGDAAAPGITGAEFRIIGFDRMWAVVSVPNPAQVVDMGDPVGSGCVLLFSSCLPPANRIVLLYTITVLPFVVSSNHIVRVIEHANPSDSNFLCPWLLLCNQPNETRLCVPDGVSCINGSTACCMIDPVEPTSWSRVKSLFSR